MRVKTCKIFHSRNQIIIQIISHYSLPFLPAVCQRIVIEEKFIEPFWAGYDNTKKSATPAVSDYTLF